MANINKHNLSEEAVRRLAEPSPASEAATHIGLYRKIQSLITEGILKEGDMLPTEMELSKMMGVGRTSLRSALILLYEDGYVRTYRGRGTFVTWNNERKDSYPRGYLLPKERILSQFGTCDVLETSVRDNSYDAFLAETLQSGDEPLRAFLRSYGADGKGIAVTNIFYPSRLTAGADSADKEASVLEKRLREAAEIHCTFTPVGSGSMSSSGVKISGEQILLVSSVWMNSEGKPIAYSKDYYNCEQIRFTLSCSI